MARKDLLADALEQLGYQAENGPCRNFYLSGTQEGRVGIKEIPTPATDSPDIVKAVSTEMFSDYLAVRLNGPKAAGKVIEMNLAIPDIDEAFGNLWSRMGGSATTPPKWMEMLRYSMSSWGCWTPSNTGRKGRSPNRRPQHYETCRKGGKVDKTIQKHCPKRMCEPYKVRKG